MTSTKLKFGLWPDARPSAELPGGLTPRGRQQANQAIAALLEHGVAARLDQEGRVRFFAGRRLSRDGQLMLERFADVIERRLRELAS
jgi:hypothetical protein